MNLTATTAINRWRKAKEKEIIKAKTTTKIVNHLMEQEKLKRAGD